MPKLILHEHKSQTGDCLPSMLRYAQSIPLRFETLEQTTAYLRSRPFRQDDGLDNSTVAQPDYQQSGCMPWQRQRVWPEDFNCWEATAHWLAHALKLLRNQEEVHIFDRTLPNGQRHVWPVLVRPDGYWLVVLDPYYQKQLPKLSLQPANLGWEDFFGALHFVGKGALGFFLGSDASAPIVKKAEELWGAALPNWSKTYSVKSSEQKPAEKPAADTKVTQPNQEKKQSREPSSGKSGMNWEDI